MAFSRQEYWRELPCPSPGNPPDPGNLPDPGIKPRSPVLQTDFFYLSHIREDLNVIAKTISLRRKQRYKYHNLEFGNGFLVMMLKAKKNKRKLHIYSISSKSEMFGLQRISSV